MTKFVTFMFAISTAVPALGAISKTGTAVCTVGQINEKFVDLNCDPRRKDFLKTPRSWMPPEGKNLRAGQTVRVQVTLERLATWKSLNKNIKRAPSKTGSKKTKGKTI